MRFDLVDVLLMLFSTGAGITAIWLFVVSRMQADHATKINSLNRRIDNLQYTVDQLAKLVDPNITINVARRNADDKPDSPARR